MDGLRAIALEKEINEQIMEKRDILEKELYRGCEKTDSAEKIYSTMILNGILFATKIAAGLALDVLIEAGIVEPLSDDEIRKNIFSVVEPSNEDLND